MVSQSEYTWELSFEASSLKHQSFDRFKVLNLQEWHSMCKSYFKKKKLRQPRSKKERILWQLKVFSVSAPPQECVTHCWSVIEFLPPFKARLTQSQAEYSAGILTSR